MCLYSAVIIICTKCQLHKFVKIYYLLPVAEIHLKSNMYKQQIASSCLDGFMVCLTTQ